MAVIRNYDTDEVTDFRIVASWMHGFRLQVRYRQANFGGTRLDNSGPWRNITVNDHQLRADVMYAFNRAVRQVLGLACSRITQARFGRYRLQIKECREYLELASWFDLDKDQSVVFATTREFFLKQSTTRNQHVIG